MNAIVFHISNIRKLFLFSAYYLFAGVFGVCIIFTTIHPDILHPTKAAFIVCEISLLLLVSLIFFYLRGKLAIVVRLDSDKISVTYANKKTFEVMFDSIIHVDRKSVV